MACIPGLEGAPSMVVSAHLCCVTLGKPRTSPAIFALLLLHQGQGNLQTKETTGL